MDGLAVGIEVGRVDAVCGVAGDDEAVKGGGGGHHAGEEGEDCGGVMHDCGWLVVKIVRG